MDIKSIYTQLTNVDIEKQKQIWDERGKGYYGEYLLFCDLYKSITGSSKILMNLNVPVDDAKTTEIDLVLIHETGIYVFEIKHHKGTIYGKNTDAVWTQYFKTVKNNTFKNPMEQNEYHIRALKRLLPNVPIHSCVVFTNIDCDIKVTNSNTDVDICKLINVSRILDNRFANSTKRYSMSDIDNIFEKLSAYSQMKEPIIIDEKEADFFSWVQPTINRLEEKKAEVENLRNSWIEQKEKLNSIKKKGIIFNILIALLCIGISVFICSEVIQNNNNELERFKQNFLHIDEIDNEYIQELNSYIVVSNASLLPLNDNAVTFTARIAMENDVYGIALSENSKYIVMTNSGKVFEYNVFGEHLKYNKSGNMIGKNIRPYGDLAKAQFYGISDINDISYIKITDVELFKLDIHRTTVKEELEIELYSK